jgi:hypothetical protein
MRTSAGAHATSRGRATNATDSRYSSSRADWGRHANPALSLRLPSRHHRCTHITSPAQNLKMYANAKVGGGGRGGARWDVGEVGGPGEQRVPMHCLNTSPHWPKPTRTPSSRIAPRALHPALCMRSVSIKKMKTKGVLVVGSPDTRASSQQLCAWLCGPTATAAITVPGTGGENTPCALCPAPCTRNNLTCAPLHRVKQQKLIEMKSVSVGGLVRSAGPLPTTARGARSVKEDATHPRTPPHSTPHLDTHGSPPEGSSVHGAQSPDAQLLLRHHQVPGGHQ